MHQEQIIIPRTTRLLNFIKTLRFWYLLFFMFGMIVPFWITYPYINTWEYNCLPVIFVFIAILLKLRMIIKQITIKEFIHMQLIFVIPYCFAVINIILWIKSQTLFEKYPDLYPYSTQRIVTQAMFYPIKAFICSLIMSPKTTTKHEYWLILVALIYTTGLDTYQLIKFIDTLDSGSDLMDQYLQENIQGLVNGTSDMATYNASYEILSNIGSVFDWAKDYGVTLIASAIAELLIIMDMIGRPFEILQQEEQEKHKISNQIKQEPLSQPQHQDQNHSSHSSFFHHFNVQNLKNLFISLKFWFILFYGVGMVVPYWIAQPNIISWIEVYLPVIFTGIAIIIKLIMIYGVISIKQFFQLQIGFFIPYSFTLVNVILWIKFNQAQGSNPQVFGLVVTQSIYYFIMSIANSLVMNAKITSAFEVWSLKLFLMYYIGFQLYLMILDVDGANSNIDSLHDQQNQALVFSVEIDDISPYMSACSQGDPFIDSLSSVKDFAITLIISLIAEVLIIFDFVGRPLQSLEEEVEKKKAAFKSSKRQRVTQMSNLG